jgi:hypothetical protein
MSREFLTSYNQVPRAVAVQYREVGQVMRISRSAVVLVPLLIVALGLPGCARAQWGFESRSMAALARELADHAENNDASYFMALSPDRQGVPDLMAQIRRSGIATNYADHLQIDTSSEAALVYREAGNAGTRTFFIVELSIVDGTPRIDQIISSRTAETAAAPDTPATVSTTVERLPDPVGPVSVSVILGSDRVTARSPQSALICYTNSSDETTCVAVPLDTILRIADTANRSVSEWAAVSQQDATDGASIEYLAPWHTTYAAVRFEAPEPGDYTLYGSANGVQAEAVSLQSVE